MKKFIKLIAWGLCALGLSAVAQSASADVLKEIVKRGELRVAVQTQGPPVSFVDKTEPLNSSTTLPGFSRFRQGTSASR